MQVLGTVGVLIEARRRGHISNAAGLVEQLAKSGFRVSEEIVERVRRVDEGYG